MTGVSQQHPVVIVSFEDEYAARFIRDLEGICPTVHVSPLLRTLQASIESLQPSIIVFDLQTIKTENHTIFEIMSSMNEAFPYVRKIALGHINMPTQVIAAMKAGACDFLDREASAQELRDTISDQLTQIRVAPGERAGHVIAIVSARENEGETELVPNLAAYIATATGKGEVLLLDLTLEESQLEIQFNVEITYSVRDALDELLRLDKAMLMEVVAKHACGVCLLPLTTRKSKDGDVSAQQLATLLSALRNFFSIIVINGGCMRDKHTKQYLMPLCDRLFVVCPQTIGSVRAACGIVSAETSGKEEGAKFRLIVTKYEADIELGSGQIAFRMGIPLAGNIPPAWVQLANSHNLGIPLVVVAPSSRYSRAIHALGDQILIDLLPHGASKSSLNARVSGWWGNLRRAAAT